MGKFVILMSILSTLFGCAKRSQALYPQDSVTAADGSKITFTFYAHASLGIAWNGIQIYVDPVGEFDILGFTLQYEMNYTGVLNMLDLAGVPKRSADRDSLKPLVIAGGPCVYNAEPMADFFDLITIGEGEEVMPELIALYRECRDKDESKAEFLKKAAQIGGVYVPSLYDISYKEDPA